MLISRITLLITLITKPHDPLRCLQVLMLGAFALCPVGSLRICSLIPFRSDFCETYGYTKGAFIVRIRAFADISAYFHRDYEMGTTIIPTSMSTSMRNEMIFMYPKLAAQLPWRPP